MPTGSGKTYVALRVVQTLLANACSLPILIVCGTNKGLDRFLEGVSIFCNKNELKRVGNASRSEISDDLSNVQGYSGDFEAVKNAKVIGVTATEAATYRLLIETLQSKITSEY